MQTIVNFKNLPASNKRDGVLVFEGVLSCFKIKKTGDLTFEMVTKDDTHYIAHHAILYCHESTVFDITGDFIGNFKFKVYKLSTGITNIELHNGG